MARWARAAVFTSLGMVALKKVSRIPRRFVGPRASVFTSFGKVALKGLEDSEMARRTGTLCSAHVFGNGGFKRRGLEDFRDGWLGQGLCVHVFRQSGFLKGEASRILEMARWPASLFTSLGKVDLNR
ncbi:hypothetical protein CEXT_82831 [Caerostris extrusa]|uniref:Uncharacterized protein n=1 Tax=Caerostris extrusa TaxID=172846 RepID=A0AAV4VWD6_CAEEX|nr:hypothetical protein CEXT_82831 [Caerostris extrusa]